MAVLPYSRSENFDTPLSGRLAALKDYSGRTKALLTALGDYWTAYYRDLEPLSHAATGSVAAVSAEYSRLLDDVLASSVLDVPIRAPLQADLLLFDERDLLPVFDADGQLDYYSVEGTGLAGISFLTSNLFESEVVLEQNRHFDLSADGTLRLYVDLFHDPGIAPYVYQVSGIQRKMLLWATDVALNGNLIYERFGRFLYRKARDSEQYKWLVTALLHFYVNEKSPRNIENVLNILYGVPYARYADETVTSIRHVDEALNPLPNCAEAAYIAIETDKTTYYTYAFSDLRVTEAQKLRQFELLSSMHTVDDYLTNPGWWEHAGFPDRLIADDGRLTPAQKREVLGTVLKYNLISITLRVSHPTWATYLSQIMEIGRIIGSGLPCYLTTLLNTIFRAAFADAVAAEDGFRIARARLGLRTRYEWRNPYRYDGGHVYNMLADPDHGSAGMSRQAGYDGAAAYDRRERHQPGVGNVPSYNGEHAYRARWLIHHGWEQDILRMPRFGLRGADAWPWEERAAPEHPFQPRYDRTSAAGGDLLFGPSRDGRATFACTLRSRTYSDAFPPPADHGRAAVTLRFAPLSDRYSAAAFQGALAYDGATPASVPADCLRLLAPVMPGSVLRPEAWADCGGALRFSGTAAYDGRCGFEGGLRDAFALTVRRA